MLGQLELHEAIDNLAGRVVVRMYWNILERIDIDICMRTIYPHMRFVKIV